MILSLLAAAGFLTILPPGPDTVMEVRRGDSFVVSGFSGQVLLEAWDRSSLEVRGEAGRAFPLLRRSGSQVRLRLEGSRHDPDRGDLVVRLPGWLPVEITGGSPGVVARGLGGGLTVRTLEGDVELSDVSGEVKVSSVQGRVRAERVAGRVHLRAGEDIRVAGARGRLGVESVDGDVRLRGLEADEVSVRTLDGDIEVEGRVSPGAEWSLETHDGDLELSLGESLNAEVEVLAYEGDFRSDFPVKVQGYRSGHRVRFTVGSGGARLVLSAFDGEITLRRGSSDPGDIAHITLRR